MRKKRNPINNQTIAIVVLAVVLIIVLGYFGFGKYHEAKEQEKVILIQQGMQVGYEQAVLQIMQQASACQAFPVFYQNATLNLIALECEQSGFQQGYEQAILQLMQEAITCNPVPVKYQNQTLNMIAVECIQAAQEQTQG